MFIGTRFPCVIDEGFHSEATYQPSDVYQNVIKNFVIGCADTIPIVGGKMLLGERQNPMSACFGKEMYFGGHMIPGQTPLETAKRELQEELNIEVKSSRFIPFDITYEIRTIPQGGFCCASFVYLIFLKKGEMEKIRLNEEFSALVYRSPKEIIKNSSDHDELVVKAAKTLGRFKWLYYLIYLYKKFFERSGD